MTSLHESADFIGPSALKHDLQDDVFRYCTFDGLDVEGQGFEGIESARDLWRLQPLRRWSHEQVEQVLT
jgi:hypothetical protein